MFKRFDELLSQMIGKQQHQFKIGCYQIVDKYFRYILDRLILDYYFFYTYHFLTYMR